MFKLVFNAIYIKKYILYIKHNLIEHVYKVSGSLSLFFNLLFNLY